jgi:hypothetical protein
VTHTAVTTQVHESFDIHGQRATQIAFHRVLGNLPTDGFNFGLGEILDLGVRLDATGIAYFQCRGTAYSVNGGQRDNRVLLWWNVNPGYSSHESYLLNGTNRLRFAKTRNNTGFSPLYQFKTGVLLPISPVAACGGHPCR